MTTPMIQRMAKAMAREDFDCESPDYCQCMARAALEAMRKATEAMYLSGEQSLAEVVDADGCRQAMIHAALHETKDAVGREGE